MREKTYEIKFKNFLERCAKATVEGVDVVIVHHPEVLGDNYSKITENLNRLSITGLKLLIIPPDERNKSK